jgi:cytochrome c-type biogenesis protein CcmH/NrfF
MRRTTLKRTAVGTATAVVFGVALAGLFLDSAAAGTPSEQKARVQRIEDAVLAPCCYTEPVSRHQSEVAVKMRVEIAKWVAGGRTDQEILDAYVRQYGSKVLVDPRTIPGWWTPWVPWLAAVLAVAFGFLILRRWRARPLPAELSAPGTDAAGLPDFDDEE